MPIANRKRLRGIFLYKDLFFKPAYESTFCLLESYETNRELDKTQVLLLRMPVEHAITTRPLPQEAEDNQVIFIRLYVVYIIKS
jgi:hypothetical protein